MHLTRFCKQHAANVFQPSSIKTNAAVSELDSTVQSSVIVNQAMTKFTRTWMIMKLKKIFQLCGFFLIASKIRSAWDIALIFFFSGWIIFFCFRSIYLGVPEPSGSVRKTAKTEKKLNGCWSLDRKFSGSGELFCSWRFFEIFFFQMFRINWTFRISKWFFIWRGAWLPKTGPNSKKWVRTRKKRQ